MSLKPAKLLQKVRRGVQTVAYANPIYQKILSSGETPERLYFTHPDPWPGDAQAGLSLLAEQRSMFDRPVLPRHAAAVFRNLRAVGTDNAKRKAVDLIEGWLDHYDGWHEAEWAPSVLGERIAAWISFYEFYAAAASPDFTAQLTESLNRQFKHLMRIMPPTLTGLEGLRAIKGLIYGGFNFPEGDKALGLALDLLKRQIGAEILPDGGHITRNPSAQLHVLRHLVDLRGTLKAADLDVPESMHTAIQSMVPALKLFRHGDGGLGLFHGGLEETPLLIDAVIMQAEAKGRVLRRLPDMSYERVTAGRGLLLIDTGRPPMRLYDAGAHAGLLSFEFGYGRERLIVNCGAVDGGPPDWRMACAATAAHSTVTIEDTNACEILAMGGILCPARVVAQRFEQDMMQHVEMSHDGYKASFGIMHKRVLSLSEDGEELRGRDLAVGAAGHEFVIRWHLHPNVQASLAQSGQTALLRTASGSGWRLRVESGNLELEPSIYCGSGAPRRSLQLKLKGRTDGTETPLTWTLVREKKN